MFNVLAVSLLSVNEQIVYVLKKKKLFYIPFSSEVKCCNLHQPDVLGFFRKKNRSHLFFSLSNIITSTPFSLFQASVNVAGGNRVFPFSTPNVSLQEQDTASNMPWSHNAHDDPYGLVNCAQSSSKSRYSVLAVLRISV